MRLLGLPADADYVRSRRRDLAPLLAAKAARVMIVAHIPPVEPGARPAHILVASRSDLHANAFQLPENLGRLVSGGLARWIAITALRALMLMDGRNANRCRAKCLVVDTTGAGDAFAAGLIHALVEGRLMADALSIAVRFGTEATLWAASSLPAKAVQRLLKEI